jgi:pimeloyl-ACP methyl ester carboxylesterase
MKQFWKKLISALLITLLFTPAAFATQLWLTLPATPQLPHPDTTGKVTVPGAQIWYATFGEGAPVVLLHGGLANSNYFGDLIPIIARTRKVIVIDSRGHGRSSNDGRQISYHLMAEDTLAVLDRLGVRKTALVGWSDGGIIGLDIAMNHPERLTSLLAYGADANYQDSLDITNSPTFNAYLARVPVEYQKLSPTPSQWQAFEANVFKMWSSEPTYSDSQLQAISVKTWIADADHEEAIARSDTDRMFHLIPNARELILPGVSHFAFLQDPSLFAGAVIAFLQR